MSDDLVAFWRARLDERERAAHHAQGLLGIATAWHRPEWLHERGLTRADAEHIALNGPDRTLREVAADRKILRLYRDQAAKAGDNAMEEDRAWTLWPVIANRAAVYGDHPDYRQEWKPPPA